MTASALTARPAPSDLPDAGEAAAAPLVDDRPMGQAMWRGWRRRCPACGAGPMFDGYLSVRRQCPVCTEDLHHHRADDGPAYLTIVVVGKLTAPSIFAVYAAFRPEPLVLAATFSTMAVALSLYLLPRLKGMVVGIQWSRRMHGFGAAAS